MKTTIEMAKEAGLYTHKEVQAELKAFEALVRADVREACAKVADDWSKRPDDVGGYISQNIRARGQA